MASSTNPHDPLAPPTAPPAPVYPPDWEPAAELPPTEPAQDELDPASPPPPEEAQLPPATPEEEIPPGWEIPDSAGTETLAPPDSPLIGPPDEPEPPPAPAPAPPQPSRQRRLVLAGGAVLLVAAGFVAGQLASRPDASSPDPEKTGEPPPGERTVRETPPVPSKPLARGERGRIDELIVEGRYQAALDVCREFDDRPSRLEPDIRYRAALCLEGLGKHEEAISLYRSLIPGTAPTPRQTAARLGLARTGLRMGQPAEPRAILCDLLLRPGEPVYQEHPYLSDAHYLLALSLASEVRGSARPSPLDPAALATANPTWPVERYLEWAAPSTRKREPVLPPPEGLKITRAGQDPRLYRVTAFRQAPVIELIDQLAREAGLTAGWTQAARDQLPGRTAQLALQAGLLEDVLRRMLLPHGLIWRIEAGRLNVDVQSALTKEALETERFREARRWLTDALTLNPDHPLASIVQLESGFLEARAGNRAEALSQFDRLTREKPRAPGVVEASYNRGLLLAAQGDTLAARDAFYLAADQASGHELTPLCYWWIGRIDLEQLDSASAERAFRRAVALDSGALTEGSAALGIAAARILATFPGAALEVLGQHRQALAHPQLHPMAAFLDALARNLAATPDTNVALETVPDLLRTVTGPRNSPVLGAVGVFLQGQGYQRLGLGERMVELYDPVIPTLRGPLAAEMNAQAAEFLFATGRREDAQRRYLQVAVGASRQADRARLRLAEIALDTGKSGECVSLCREILTRNAIARDEVLGLMGRAFRAQGDYRRAAQCFAGEIPA